MKPIEFPEQNGVRTAPPGQPEVLPLPVHSDGRECISCWRCSWRERLSILLTGVVWLCVRSGHTQPPVLVTAEYTFVALAQVATAKRRKPGQPDPPSAPHVPEFG